MNNVYHIIPKHQIVNDFFLGSKSHVQQQDAFSQRIFKDVEDQYNMHLYMSPPSLNWTTVGYVATVRRSSSILRYHSNLMYRTSRPQRSDINTRNYTKKKDGLSRFFKYRFWRHGKKEDNEHSQTKAVVQLVEISNSSSKRKPRDTSDHYQSHLPKLRAIKKSFTTLFSRSNGTPRADQSAYHQQSCEDNRGLQLFDEKNSKFGRRCLYEQSPQSSTRPGPKATPSCTGEPLLSPLDISCCANNNYRTDDNGWKSVIENVCRRNSKDSALADSTLSEDGMPSECNRISPASTICRGVDRDYFYDSCYSSFNDLRENSCHNSYSKYQLISAAFQRRSTETEYKTMDSLSVPSAKSISNLRTDTCQYRRYQHLSHSTTNCRRSRSPNTGTGLKRAHSWPCSDHSQTMFPLRKFDVISATLHCQVLKTIYTKRDRTSASPLLTQYSKLYSLRSYVARDVCHQYRLSDFSEVASAVISIPCPPFLH